MNVILERMSVKLTNTIIILSCFENSQKLELEDYAQKYGG